MTTDDKEIVLVTGGNTGLGFEYARALLADHPDRFFVLIGARSRSKGEDAVQSLQSMSHAAYDFIQIDVSNDESIATAVRSVADKHGRLDVLNVNAGIAPGYNLTSDDYSMSHVILSTMAVNVAGAAQTAKSFVPLLLKAQNPRIIFISSALGSLTRWEKLKFNKEDPAYGASKAAISAITLWFSQKYEDIKVNACNPGYRATQINKSAPIPPGIKAGELRLGVANAVRLTLAGADDETGTNTQMDDLTGEVQYVPW